MPWVREESISPIALTKMHSDPQQKRKEDESREEPEKSKGLAIHIEDCATNVDSAQMAINFQESLGGFLVANCRNFIPYRLRTIILYILCVSGIII